MNTRYDPLVWTDEPDPHREGAVLHYAEIPEQFGMPGCRAHVQETSAGCWQWMMLASYGCIKLSDDFPTADDAKRDCTHWLENP